MTTWPRGGRRPALPHDPAPVLRALRACRSVATGVCAAVEIRGPVYLRAEAVTAAIDLLAEALTGIRDYFHEPGGGAPPDERAEQERRRAVERGDIPWPR
jgi:hypothetical protein